MLNRLSRAAFEDQTSRLYELLDICIATQAELENERTVNRRWLARSDSTLPGDVCTLNNIGSHENQPFGTATILGNDFARPRTCFSRVEILREQCDYGSALREVDHLLRGPLVSESRVEGLLVKSDLLRKSDLLYDALAACGEALELCDNLQELQANLPRIHYQRAVCYHQLRMVKQTREALSEIVPTNNSLSAKARALLDSCDDQINVCRRSGFETHRIYTEGTFMSMGEVLTEVRNQPRSILVADVSQPKRRSASSQIRLHVQKGKRRLSLPRRWITPRSTSGGTN